MVDVDLVMAKSGAVKKYLSRIKEKRQVDLNAFLADLDRQEIIVFNFQMALQNCIDMASHIISDRGLGMPGSTNELFYILEENGYIDHALTEKMVKAVGFRNLIVHEYGKVEIERVFDFAQNDVEDLHKFIQAIFECLDIT